MKRASVSALFSHLIVVLALSTDFAFAQKITTFDVPDGIATTPTAISPLGEVIGYYGDQSIVAVRGFVRNPDGAITIFDAPGSHYTIPMGISPLGEMVGYDGENTGPSYAQVGFVRATGGTITTFVAGEPPVTPVGVDLLGLVAGYWVDGVQSAHGFLRARNGTITSFVAGNQGFVGTVVTSINILGQCTGTYDELSPSPEDTQHGFVREPDGTIVSFDVLNATDTYAESINDFGDVAGSYKDVNGASHGFLRHTNGTFTTFNVPGATDTGSVAINVRGQIVGRYLDANSESHGFVRERDGTIRRFSVPNSKGTFPAGINAIGEVAGVYFDLNGDQHGFVTSPFR